MKKETLFPVETPAPLLEFLLERVKGQARNSVKHLLSRGQVLVDGVPQRRFDLPLTPGQTVTVLPQAKGAALPFPVLYEDEGLFAVYKPAGLLSVSTGKGRERTAYRLAVDYLRARDPHARLFVVHRLDRDTSGVLLFAKTEELKNALQENWNGRVKRRGYRAVVEGTELPDSGVCRSLLSESKAHKVFSTRGDSGQEAVTHYRVLDRWRGFSLLDVSIDTGRKNQIRVHLSELGFPIAGDEKYGARSDPMGRLALHACELTLTDPRSGKQISFTAPPPEGFRRMFPKAFPPLRQEG